MTIGPSGLAAPAAIAVARNRSKRARTLGREEPAVRLDEAAVGRGVDGGRDVTRVRIDRLDLAAVARRPAGIEQDHLAETVAQRVAIDDLRPVVRQFEARAGRRRRRDAPRQRVTGGDPRLDPAVEHGYAAAMPEVVEHPPQPRGDPAADVVVGDNEVVRADPGPGERRRERGRGGERVPARPAGRGATASSPSRSRKIAPGMWPPS